MAGISPVSRTLEYLRKNGFLAEKVEYFNPYAGKFGKRRDIFNFIDILALGEGEIIAIQVCGTDFSSHHKKMTEEESVANNVYKWLQSGGKIKLISWRKVKLKRGGKAMRWSPRIRTYYLNDKMEIEWEDEK